VVALSLPAEAAAAGGKRRAPLPPLLALLPLLLPLPLLLLARSGEVARARSSVARRLGWWRKRGDDAVVVVVVGVAVLSLLTVLAHFAAAKGSWGRRAQGPAASEGGRAVMPRIAIASDGRGMTPVKRRAGSRL
jgi:hypothetical protein